MGALIGLTFGAGALLVWRAWAQPDDPDAGRLARPGRRGIHERLAELIAQAGLDAVTPRQVLTAGIGAGLVVGTLFLAVSRTWPIALAFAVLAGGAPLGLVRMRARIRRRELRDHWPDVVDNLASAVRAGLSLPDALAQVGARGPEPLRGPFERFGEDYRASGRFHDCLDALKARLADPTGDRIAEALRAARDVGGSDLGQLLRTLSIFLRDDARVRSELETRQGWVINAARLAVAAPWALLGVLSLRSAAVQSFNSPPGWFVLLGGAAMCLVAYRLMIRIGRLPTEERVLR